MGWSLIKPAMGSGSCASTVLPEATVIPPWVATVACMAVSILSSSTPATTMLWWSCATVLAMAPSRRPRPFTKPRPTLPGGQVALDDGHLQDVAFRIGHNLTVVTGQFLDQVAR